MLPCQKAALEGVFIKTIPDPKKVRESSCKLLKLQVLSSPWALVTLV